MNRFYLHAGWYLAIAVTGIALLLWNMELHAEFHAMGWDKYRGVDIDRPGQILGFLLFMSGTASLFFSYRVYKSYGDVWWEFGRINGLVLLLLALITIIVGGSIFGMDGTLGIDESFWLWLPLCLLIAALSYLANRFKAKDAASPDHVTDLEQKPDQALEKKFKIRRLKARYTVLMGAGATALIVSIFTVPIAGGISGTITDVTLYFNAKAISAALSDRFTEHTYSQTGTDVGFTKFDVSYNFTLNGEQYVGSATIDQSPVFVREIIVYYDPSEPTINTPHKVGVGKLSLLAALWLPIPASILLLGWGGLNYRKFKVLGGR